MSRLPSDQLSRRLSRKSLRDRSSSRYLGSLESLGSRSGGLVLSVERSRLRSPRPASSSRSRSRWSRWGSRAPLLLSLERRGSLFLAASRLHAGPPASRFLGSLSPFLALGSSSRPLKLPRSSNVLLESLLAARSRPFSRLRRGSLSFLSCAFPPGSMLLCANPGGKASWDAGAPIPGGGPAATGPPPGGGASGSPGAEPVAAASAASGAP